MNSLVMLNKGLMQYKLQVSQFKDKYYFLCVVLGRFIYDWISMIFTKLFG